MVDDVTSHGPPIFGPRRSVGNEAAVFESLEDRCEVPKEIQGLDRAKKAQFTHYSKVQDLAPGSKS
jgi:hypothetical protein